MGKTQAEKNADKKRREAEAEANKYVSPLTDELNLTTMKIGEGVEVYHDTENGRLLIDIDILTRRGLSSSGKTIKIATANHPIGEKMKLSLNVYDKDMNMDELDKLSDFIVKKAKEKDLKEKLKALD